MEEKLINILGEELSKQVKEKLQDKKIAIINDGSWIPKEKFDSKNEELKLTKQQLEDYKKNAVNVENIVNENAELKTKYEKVKSDFEDGIKSKDNEISNINKKYSLLNELKKCGAVGEDLLLNKFNLDDIELNSEGKIKGFDELVKPLKENYKHMFKETNIEGTKPTNTNSSVNDTDIKNPFSKENWNMTEQIKLYKENPEMYNKLKTLKSNK
jgi:hypothetical protein